MNDDQRLSLLDRRAAAATAALDEAVQQVPVPEPDLGAPRRSVRRFLPLAVAACLAVVALVGAALVFDDDEQGTIADDGSLVESQDGPTGLGLADPAAAGYEILAAFDASTVPDQTDVEMVVQGPAGADDPWDAAVVTFDVPADQSVLNGEVVDVGGPEAAYQSVAGRDAVIVRDGETLHQILTTRVEKADLVSLAADAARTGRWDPLPGHDVLHRGSGVEVFADLTNPASSLGRAGIAYEHNGDDDFVMTWMPGNELLWRASFALAHETQRVAIGDRTGIVVTPGQRSGGPTMASWLEPDDTLIQVATHGDIDRVLETIQDHAAPIEEDAFASLVARHPVSDNRPLLDHSSSTIAAWDERPLLASVRETVGPYDFAVELRGESGQHSIDLVISDPNGSSGSGSGLVDLDTTLMHRSSVGSGPEGGQLSEVVIGGLVGPGLRDIAVVDASTRHAIPLLTRSSTTVDGTDRVVFLAIVEATFRDTPMEVHATTDDGVIRYRV